jgi:hypothetical protein
MVFSLKNIVHKRKHWVQTKNRILINPNCAITYGNPQNNVTFGFVGSAGRGKTVSLYATAEQFPNAICFDPKGGALDALDFLGIRNKWEIFKIRKEKNITDKFLEINAREIVEGIENILAFKRKLEHKAMVSREFIRLDLNERTYENLKRIFCQRKMEYVMDDLDPILSKTDSGMTIEEVVNGKKLVDIIGLSVDNRCIAVLVWLIINYKRKLKEKESLTHKHFLEPLFLSCDDCQSYAGASMALGKAFEISFSEGRQFLISSCLAGTNRGKLAMSVKGNMTTLFIFASKTEVDTFWQKEKIDVDIRKLQELDDIYGQKGNFYLHIEEQPELSQYAHYDLEYFKKVRNKKKEPSFEKAPTGNVQLANYL